MSATATAAASSDTTQITYPISPEYVAGWNGERALAELVANAYDDDRDFTFEWADGVLTIEDQGPGVPEEGLILGWSSKRGKNSDQFIGIHGEGLKIASLVLARAPEIGEVVIETVGFGFIPSVTNGGRLVPVGGRRATKHGTQLLAYEFFPSARQRGTKITVECSQELAQAVHDRFLFLAQPGYEPPVSGGRVLDLPGGRIYIGGVFIAADSKRLFSYDFSLESAKRSQNRDRTVLDASIADALIREALVALDDEALIERWVDRALNGKLTRAEQSFPYTLTNPAQHRAWRAVAKRIFAGRQVTWSDGFSDAEAVLDLSDRGYEILDPKGLTGHARNSLFHALGIPQARTQQKRPSSPTKTTWVKPEQLTESERAILDQAITMVRAAFGVEAVGRCDAYESTRVEGVDAELAWGGFYTPTREGRIGIQRRNLQSLDDTLDVLVHEAAHRLRHRGHRYDYQDRTRGFEWQLGQMAARALKLAAQGGLPDADALVEQQEQEQAFQAEHPAALMRELLKQRAKDTGLSVGELADECGVSAGSLRQMRDGRYRVWAGHRRAEGPPMLARSRAISERLGVEWSVAHLALLSELLWQPPVQDKRGTWECALTRRGSKRAKCAWVNGEYVTQVEAQRGQGRIMGVRGDEIQICIERLRAIGADPMLVDALQSHLDHGFDGSDYSWLEPYRALVRAQI